MPTPPDASSLTAHLGFWLRAVSNHVSHAFAVRLAARGVTVAEWVMLRALFREPPTAPSRLADAMGMTRGAITRLADRLIAKGVMLRKARTEDLRAQTLALTPEGAALVPDLAALADRNDAEFFGAMAEADRRNLERILKAMAARHGMRAMPLE